MKLISYIKIIIFSVIFFVNHIAYAEDPGFAFQQLTNFRTYVATFEQSTYDVHGQRLQQGRGRVMIMRPGFFRWETDTPTRQILMTDGKVLWVYDVDLAQATQQPLQEKTNINPAALLSGSITDLNQQFNISIRSIHEEQQFLLQPKQNNVSFKWIRLSFKKGRLVSMKVLNNLDEISEFSFSQVRINTPLSPYLFQFKPAAGVDIVNS